MIACKAVRLMVSKVASGGEVDALQLSGNKANSFNYGSRRQERQAAPRSKRVSREGIMHGRWLSRVSGGFGEGRKQYSDKVIEVGA